MTARVPMQPFSRGMRAGQAELDNLALGLPLRIIRTPIATGFSDLDMILGGTAERPGGLIPGEVTILGAETGVGKSSFAEQVALVASIGNAVTYFALELGKERVVERLLAKISEIDHKSIQNLLQFRRDHDLVHRGARRLAEDHDLIVEERPSDEPYTIDHIEAITLGNEAKLVIIDDLQSLDGWNDSTKLSHQGNVEIVRSIRRIARSTGAHFLIPHQLVKNWRRAPKQKPGRNDLADCAQLSRDADAVICLHRPFLGQGSYKDRVLEVIVDKNRNGYEATLHLERVPARLAFRDMDPRDEAELECCKRHA